MIFVLPDLPYDINALEPHISQTTMEYHYGKHHQAYVDNLNKLIEGTQFSSMSLDEIIVATANKPEYVAIFNNAAQVFNHSFFWNSMSPSGGSKPKGELAERIDSDFGSYDNFKKEFKQAALSQFGSGWAWLVDDNGKLKITKTANADTPIAYGQKPIITIDVWEHAYYLDYQNKRADFIDVFFNNLVNWNQE